MGKRQFGLMKHRSAGAGGQALTFTAVPEPAESSAPGASLHRPRATCGDSPHAARGSSTHYRAQVPSWRGWFVCLFLFGMNLAHRSHSNLANQRRRGWMHEVSHGDAGNYWGLAGLVLSICKQNPVLLPGFHLFITVSLCWHMRAKSKIVSKAAGKLMVED